jgi:hypothetical protein
LEIAYIGTLWDPPRIELITGVSCSDFAVGNIALRKLVLKKGSTIRSEAQPDDYLLIGYSGRGMVRKIDEGKITESIHIGSKDIVQINGGTECELSSYSHYEEDLVLIAVTTLVAGQNIS